MGKDWITSTQLNNNKKNIENEETPMDARLGNIDFRSNLVNPIFKIKFKTKNAFLIRI